MEQPAKTCPKCGSGDYTIRGRICQLHGVTKGMRGFFVNCAQFKCSHEWGVRTLAKGLG